MRAILWRRGGRDLLSATFGSGWNRESGGRFSWRRKKKNEEELATLGLQGRVIKEKGAVWEPSHPTMVDVASSDAHPYRKKEERCLYQVRWA
jgi:hypothetical protein